MLEPWTSRLSHGPGVAVYLAFQLAGNVTWCAGTVVHACDTSDRAKAEGGMLAQCMVCNGVVVPSSLGGRCPCSPLWFCSFVALLLSGCLSAVDVAGASYLSLYSKEVLIAGLKSRVLAVQLQVQQRYGALSGESPALGA